MDNVMNIPIDSVFICQRTCVIVMLDHLMVLLMLLVMLLLILHDWLNYLSTRQNLYRHRCLLDNRMV